MIRMSLRGWRQQRATLAELSSLPGWQESVGAFRAYRKRPSGSRLDNIVRRPLAHAGVWYGERGEGSTRRPSGLALFEAAASAGAIEDCRRIFHELLGALRDPAARGALRFLFAARVLLAHDHPELADALLSERRSDDEDLEAALTDCFLLRARCRAHPSNEDLFRELLRSRPAQLRTVMVEWLRSRWRFESPSPALLKEAMERARATDFDKQSYYEECVALALCVGDATAVEALLEANQSLLLSYKRVLPLARYIYKHGHSAHHQELPDLAFHARLHDHLDVEGAALEERLGDPLKTIGIVGNSPCELGKGKGSVIDAHDIVVRFNLFSTEAKFATDYGQKFQVHCRRHPNDHRINELSMQAQVAMLGGHDCLHVQRKWDHFLRMWQDGAKLCIFPAPQDRALRQELQAPPSLGLASCAHLKSIRGKLSRESCFGFSFVDHLGAGATSSHYFEEIGPVLTHRWTQEREIFDRLVDR